MDGYKVPALGIVDSEHRLIGWITAVELVGANVSTKVRDVMANAPTPLQADITIRDAAGELVKSDVDYLPVVKGGRYFAIVTARSLLGKLRESYDPMTELPWSDALREWGVDKLEHNAEIAVLFIDLDHFGSFNKQYGHVIGDRVIQRAAEHIKTKIDPTQDILVRYGGDEFAIATIRPREEAEELMNRLTDYGEGLAVDHIGSPVTFTIGIYGGKRTKMRHDIHIPSNVDDLVNLASRDCLAKKEGFGMAVVQVPQRESENAPVAVATTPQSPDSDTGGPAASAVPTERVTQATVPEPDPVVSEEIDSEAVVEDVVEPVVETQAPVAQTEAPVIETIQADDEPGSLTYVVVKYAGKLAVGVSPKMGHSRAESIAIATGKALEKTFAESRVTIDSVNIERAGSTELVTARVRALRDGVERDITAQAEANGDLDDTVGLVVISAFLAE